MARKKNETEMIHYRKMVPKPLEKLVSLTVDKIIADWNAAKMNSLLESINKPKDDI